MIETIDRSYRNRGRVVQLQELTGLAAVRSASIGAVRGVPPKTAAPQAAVPQRVSAAELTEFAPAEILPQLRAFEDSGWAIVPRGRAADGARVYLKPGNRIALDSGRLIVRVGGDRTEAEARGLLERQGFSVLSPLKLAPNVFTVAVPVGSDALTAAARLADSKDVEFAEPDLIEVVPGR